MAQKLSKKRNSFKSRFRQNFILGLCSFCCVTIALFANSSYSCDYTQGKWVFNPDRTAAYDCCEASEDPECCLEIPFNQPLFLNSSCRAQCDYFKHPFISPYCLQNYQNVAKYSWQSCLPKLDSRHFCKRLGTRKIYFVGDSLTKQTFSALINLVRDHCTGFTFIKDYTCVGEFKQFGAKYFVGEGMQKYSFEENSVVVFNSGAHIQANFTKYLLLLRNSLMEAKNKNPSVRFIWRDILPGHPECGGEPWQHYETFKKIDWNGKHSYQWEKFEQWNVLIREAMGDLDIPTIRVDFMKLRPDAHMGWECLHWCYPVMQFVVDAIVFRILEII